MLLLGSSHHLLDPGNVQHVCESCPVDIQLLKDGEEIQLDYGKNKQTKKKTKKSWNMRHIETKKSKLTLLLLINDVGM